MSSDYSKEIESAREWRPRKGDVAICLCDGLKHFQRGEAYRVTRGRQGKTPAFKVRMTDGTGYDCLVVVGDFGPQIL